MPALGAARQLSQFFQTVQGYSPLGSGLRILPWTIMPMFVAPIAGALSDRIGGPRLMGVGLTLQATGLASLAALSTQTTPYWQLVAPFVVSGALSSARRLRGAFLTADVTITTLES